MPAKRSDPFIAKKMDHIEKFIRLLSPKQRERVRHALAAIVENRLSELDIKPLTGKKNWFRCRIGDIRILFIRTGSGTHVIWDIQFRGKAYRGM